jgi:hypothetical protein
MPDLNPNFTGKTVRTNGSWGRGVTAKTLGSVSYVNGYVGTATQGAGGVTSSGAAVPCASATGPFCNSGNFAFGDAPRVMPFDGLRNPSVYNLNAGIRRSFNLTPERVKFIFGVDCQNVTNKVTFGGIGVNVDAANFGAPTTATSNTGSRDFQFSGRLNF